MQEMNEKDNRRVSRGPWEILPLAKDDSSEEEQQEVEKQAEDVEDRFSDISDSVRRRFIAEIDRKEREWRLESKPNNSESGDGDEDGGASETSLKLPRKSLGFISGQEVNVRQSNPASSIWPKGIDKFGLESNLHSHMEEVQKQLNLRPWLKEVGEIADFVIDSIDPKCSFHVLLKFLNDFGPLSFNEIRKELQNHQKDQGQKQGNSLEKLTRCRQDDLKLSNDAFQKAIIMNYREMESMIKNGECSFTQAGVIDLVINQMKSASSIVGFVAGNKEGSPSVVFSKLLDDEKEKMDPAFLQTLAVKKSLMSAAIRIWSSKVTFDPYKVGGKKRNRNDGLILFLTE